MPKTKIPATPRAARIGIAKIKGEPKTPENISVNMVVGSSVDAETCKEASVNGVAERQEEVVGILEDGGLATKVAR
jgi:hypothetical protein